jgi:hypothetical protein
VSEFDPFARHRSEKAPEDQSRPERTQKVLPAQKLLDWIQHDWPKPIISARDIQRLGPNSVRGRRKAIKLTEALVEHGHLIPIQTRRRNMKRWQIVQGGEG